MLKLLGVGGREGGGASPALKAQVSTKEGLGNARFFFFKGL